MFDVLIVGGGPAGLSAGLVLGRFKRSVLICDSQQPRNAKSSGVHGFLSRDGIHPQDLLRISREQLAPYPSVQFQAQEVVEVAQDGAHFSAHFQDGTSVAAKKVLFATGVKDMLPPLDGLDELWGKSVFHCPYCHGWEARDQALAILANGDNAVHLAKLLHALSADLVICTNGPAEIAASQRPHLERHGIRVIETPIRHLQRQDTTLQGIAFADGSYLQRDAIFVRTAQSQHSQLPAALGCALTANGHIVVDDLGKTSVSGVFAAGDLASPMQQVLYAAAKGAAAAAGINTELAHESFVS